MSKVILTEDIFKDPKVEQLISAVIQAIHINTSMTSVGALVALHVFIGSLSMYLLDLEVFGESEEQKVHLKGEIFRATHAALDRLKEMDVKAVYDKAKTETHYDQILASLDKKSTAH